MSMFVFVFLFGLLTPFVASRFGKFIPTDPGSTLAQLWHRPRFPKGLSFYRKKRLYEKWFELFSYGLMWGIVLVIALRASIVAFPDQAPIWALVFFCILALLCAIDEQFFILPDVLTVPFIVLGFGYAIYGDNITPQASFAGACYGYILPTIAVFVTARFIKDGFGGGDVKMLIGMGAWLGIYGMSLALFISVLSFALWAMIYRKRVGAYGPHLAIGAAAAFFLMPFISYSFL